MGVNQQGWLEPVSRTANSNETGEMEHGSDIWDRDYTMTHDLLREGGQNSSWVAHWLSVPRDHGSNPEGGEINPTSSVYYSVFWKA